MSRIKKRIAFCGKMGAGKDFLADEMIDMYGYHRYAFGDYVKASAQMIFPDKFETDEKPRKLIQQFGQKMREIDENVWVDMLVTDIDAQDEQRKRFGYTDGMFVVTDVRQPNEYAKLKEMGFVFVRVEARDDVRIRRMKERRDSFDIEDLTHETELYIDSFEVDYVVTNNDDYEVRDRDIPGNPWEQLEAIIFGLNESEGGND